MEPIMEDSKTKFEIFNSFLEKAKSPKRSNKRKLSLRHLQEKDLLPPMKMFAVDEEKAYEILSDIYLVGTEGQYEHIYKLDESDEEKDPEPMQIENKSEIEIKKARRRILQNEVPNNTNSNGSFDTVDNSFDSVQQINLMNNQTP